MEQHEGLYRVLLDKGGAMRVRYQMVGQDSHARCDMTSKAARKFYDELSHKGFCEWAELVGEDDDDYMDVLDSFDHVKIARMFGSIMGVI